MRHERDKLLLGGSVHQLQGINSSNRRNRGGTNTQPSQDTSGIVIGVRKLAQDN